MAQSTRGVELINSKPVLAALGLASHFIFHTGEWDGAFYAVILVWMLGFGGIAATEHLYDPQATSIGAAIRVTTVAAAIYFGTLITSILVYRAFFHRLRKFPGPFGARLSKIYGIYVGVFPNFQYFKWTEKLYEKYQSDVIRTGPREVTVYCADAVTLIHGPMSRCSKGPWYSAGNFIGGWSTQTTRNKDEHRRRRKLWDLALNAKALREYEPRLNRHALALMTRLKGVAEQPTVRITDWVNFYSFDVMGDIGFNKSFGMVEKGEEADVIKLLHKSMEPFSIFSHIIWGINLLLRIPGGAKDMVAHIDWTRDVLAERVKVTPAENDIFGRLLDPNDPKVTQELNADSRLLVVAGSDTTAATLGCIAYELCKNPEVQLKLRKAVDLLAPKKSHLDVDDVSNCPYLDGVINEALRLHPAVPSGVQRETPPEGITLPNGTYIPGETLIWMPIHCIQRDPRYWQKPLTFLPERWTDEEPEAVIDKRAWLVFSSGPYNCIGQKLAMLELRTVTANLIRLFEISFADGEDGDSVENKSRDCFTTNLGKLDVKLTPRYKA